MVKHLTAEQRRVLGVLMEKSLATPEYYPMTLNAVVAACSQKSNRNPVVRYSEGDVGRALHELAQMDLVGQADTAHGARANRFEHRVREGMEWNRRHRAVMAELLLRGPQTLGELRTRSARMVPLPDQESVASVLEELANMDPPRVRVFAREPGRSAVRYDHMLYSPEELTAPVVTAAAVAEPRPIEKTRDPGLSARIERLEAEVTDLRAVVEDLRQHLSRSDATVSKPD